MHTEVCKKHENANQLYVPATLVYHIETKLANEMSSSGLVSFS